MTCAKRLDADALEFLDTAKARTCGETEAALARIRNRLNRLYAIEAALGTLAGQATTLTISALRPCSVDLIVPGSDEIKDTESHACAGWSVAEALIALAGRVGMLITRTILRDWGACYSNERIAELIPPDGLTIRQILDLPIPAADRIWVAIQPGVLSDRALRLFAVRCARRALDRAGSPDPRSVAACDVAERFANGLATAEELAAARAAAAAAAADAADAAADAAAAWAAADAAADAAAAWAARAAAAAARAAAAAADTAAWADAAAAARAAAAAAWAAWAARAAERDQQVQDLIALVSE